MNRMYKLGIIGLSPGNGHPYSWSAIFNGYDKPKMAECPFPVIPEYLGREEASAFGIEGAKVTHIWTQDVENSRQVAEASLIENVVTNAEDMIGQVDAVILARDDGENHLAMAKPFIEEGIPIFIDKPLTENAKDLREFVRYYEEAKPIMSCSSVRYWRSILGLKSKTHLGRILTANAVTPKYWRTYGIHLIEGIYAVMGGGVESAQNVGLAGEEIVHIRYTDGRHAVLQSFKGVHSNLHISFYGQNDSVFIQDTDAFFCFKKVLTHFVDMVKTGNHPFDWRETVETVKIVIAGRMSLEEGNRIVYLKEIA